MTKSLRLIITIGGLESWSRVGMYIDAGVVDSTGSEDTEGGLGEE
jgi:hypothetical protein